MIGRLYLENKAFQYLSIVRDQTLSLLARSRLERNENSAIATS